MEFGNLKTGWMAMAMTLAAAGSALAAADGFTQANVQFVYGKDLGSFKEYNGKPFTMWSFELVNGWAYGDNVFLTDWNKGPTLDKTDVTTAYGELHNRLSLGKITGKPVGFGPVKDVLLASEIDLPSGFTPAYMLGAGANLDIPGFAFATVNFLLRNELASKGVSFQINPVWVMPLSAGSVKGEFRGWIDVMTGEGPGQSMWWQAQPALFLDVANFWGAPGKLLMGCEYEYFHNFLGFSKKDINHPQFVALWNL